MWLNFLLALGRRWDEATEDDAEYFKEWRLSEQSNPRLVEASTFAANLAGLRKFYRWAARRYGVADPVAAMDDFDLKPRGVRGQDAKWLDPAGYRRWRDLGVRGLGLGNTPTSATTSNNSRTTPAARRPSSGTTTTHTPSCNATTTRSRNTARASNSSSAPTPTSSTNSPSRTRPSATSTPQGTPPSHHSERLIRLRNDPRSANATTVVWHTSD
ncbi:hypothetical protein [Actinocrispum sp. NPDC049592]|uniref:hypothetical protein n=1 Tax=Actinocrispum sp. NPDC049592 TaxID=3154835 RepID=UPI003441F713